ncbi:MAG: 3-phosphoshikimate 1-carboxyvinyltransferase [Chloroflexota bacterium]|nr:3-phosphoshikimate 1-carboxyvinyltransferase [Chloroflexota bacterium]
MKALTITSDRPLSGSFSVPGDKSISHRALLLGALASGVTHATGFLPSADCLSTLACLTELGVRVERPTETSIVVHGVGMGGLAEPSRVLDCGNSGTTMRLLSGILAGHSFFSIVAGDESLHRRPMARIADPLRRMGATVLGRQGGNLPPLAIVGGRLRALDYRLPVASAQVKSCLLLAALFADGPTTLQEPSASRDHTERMLRAMGVELTTSAWPDGTSSTPAPGPVDIRIKQPQAPLRALDLAIPGDISSAAFFLVAAAIAPRSRLQIQNVGVNPTRTGILDVLAAMGAHISVENQRLAGGEPVADLQVRTSDLRATEVRGSLIPRLLDELPVIAVAATQAHGVTTVRDAAELRVKESDRISALVTELRKLGAMIEEFPDGFVVQGPAPLHGSVVDAHGDHRLAMSLAVAALVAHGETTILGAESIAVSFPGFERALAERRGETRWA